MSTGSPRTGSSVSTSEGSTSISVSPRFPSVWGEKIVLRVHSKEIAFQDLEDLGLSPGDHATVLRCIRRPFGMVLMTGPTASGKNTSLYAALIKLGPSARTP